MSGTTAVRELKKVTNVVAGAQETPLETFANHLLFRWMTAEQVVREADADLSGEIEIEEFNDLCRNTLRLPFNDKQIEEVFNAVDADKSGSCSQIELQRAIEAGMKTMEVKMMMANKPVTEEGDVRQETKLVALVAHNNMKPSMMSFVAKHRDFFKTVQIVTTGSTGASLEKKVSELGSDSVPPALSKKCAAARMPSPDWVCPARVAARPQDCAQGCEWPARR